MIINIERELLRLENAICISYADDILLLFADNNVKNIFYKMHAITKIITNWMMKNQMSINPDKSTILLIPKNAQDRVYYNYYFKLLNVKINISKELKYLGIIIDSQLKFKQHIRHIYQKSIIRIAQFKNIFSRWNGWHCLYKYSLIPSIFISSIIYGINIWGFCINVKQNKQKLNSLLRIILKKFFNSPFNVSEIGLFKFYNILPIELQYLKSSLRHYFKHNLHRSIEYTNNKRYLKMHIDNVINLIKITDHNNYMTIKNDEDILLDYKNIYKVIDEYIKNKFITSCCDSNKASDQFHLIKFNHFKPDKTLIQFDKKIITFTNNLILSNSFYINQIKFICPYCLTNMTSKHFFITCPALEKYRIILQIKYNSRHSDFHQFLLSNNKLLLFYHYSSMVYKTIFTKLLN